MREKFGFGAASYACVSFFGGCEQKSGVHSLSGAAAVARGVACALHCEVGFRLYLSECARRARDDGSSE